MLKALRKGGYVIYFRHASTDFSRDDSRSRADDDCENQRPLTDTGREDARQIGAAMRELEIPVGKVLASPRCRAMETAMLAFGRAETSAAVRGGPGRDSGRRAYLAEGEAAVVRPPGKDFEIVARVRHDAWGVLQGKH